LKITDNVFLVDGVVANPYILVDPDGLTVIDTGLPGSDNKILAFAASLGHEAHDIKRIILTHADMDHVGGLSALQQATGARTYASQIEAQAIAAGRSSRQIKPRGFSLRRLLFAIVRPFMKAAPLKVDEILEDGQTLPPLGGLRVLATPGHTPGHISLFAPQQGLLFCGDSIVSDKDGLYGSRPGLTWDEAQARESERKQAALGATIVCSGHGPVVTEATGKFPVNLGPMSSV
jgi:glyoxylase-like metal-dependent hydrolase (beta-lactamase superfamily II)